MNAWVDLKDVGRGGYDEPMGVIIGDIVIEWELCYDGKPKSHRETAASYEEAIAAAKAKCDELKAEFCGHPYYFYPDPTKWTVRTW